MKIYFQKRGFEAYRFLSNFYLSPIRGGDVVFATAEHAYQAQKATNETDFLAILNAGTPKEAKDIGARIRLRSDWEEQHPGSPFPKKLVIMANVLRHKFNQNPELADLLIETGDAELIEWAPWGDTYWGVNADGVGANHLGELLMKIRQQLQDLGYIKLRDLSR